MNSVAIRILALSLLGAVYLGAWCPAYASTGGCHQSCTATWRAERKIAIANWVACKTGCTGLSSQEKAACSAQCFQDKNAALVKAKEDLHQCFRVCQGTTGSCHQSCTAAWRQERKTAIDNWVACKTGCT